MTDNSKLTFDELAARTYGHDPATCTREPCGRCHPKGGVAKPPPVKANPHDAQPPSKPSLPKELDPIALANALEAAAKQLRTSGTVTWARFHDWTPAPRIPTYPGADDPADKPADGTPDPTRPARSAEDERDRLENAQAGRYWAELATVAPRVYADANRLKRLVDIANQPRPKAAPENMQGCELCTQAGLKKDGKPIPYEHTSNVGERLPRDMRLCQAHYLYVQRHDHAPTPEQTRHWSTHGTWKVKAHA